MLGKASELRFKQLTWSAPFVFNMEDYKKHKTLGQLLDEWIQSNPDCIVDSIQFIFEGKNHHALIIYKEATT